MLDRSALCRDFVENGFSEIDLGSTHVESLSKLRAEVVNCLKARSSRKPDQGLSDVDCLNRFHEWADLAQTNDLRLALHREVGAKPQIKTLVYDMVRAQLETLIGPEIVMQRQLNFVVHLPHDPANVIYLHTDSWSGCSPFEVILWLPLVDVSETKSMFVCPRPATLKHLRQLRGDSPIQGAHELLERVRPDCQTINMKFGKALLFSPILLHGAEENKTEETRFVINVRFKALFSPYGSKALGETFLPVSYLPATQVGTDYEREFGVVGE